MKDEGLREYRREEMVNGKRAPVPHRQCRRCGKGEALCVLEREGRKKMKDLSLLRNMRRRRKWSSRSVSGRKITERKNETWMARLVKETGMVQTRQQEIVLAETLRRTADPKYST